MSRPSTTRKPLPPPKARDPLERTRNMAADDSNGSRSSSLSSATVMVEKSTFDNVDDNKLYEAILKLVILEYTNEARFRTLVVSESTQPDNALAVQRSPPKRRAMLDVGSVSDSKLPPSVYIKLENRLNLMAMQRDSRLDANIRRSLLRFYSELLDPNVKNDLKRNNTPEYLLMRFVASANKEVTKLGVSQSEVSNVVFQQAEHFVAILIQIVQKERNGELIISKLSEHKESLKPQKSASTSVASMGEINHIKPSYKLKDFDKLIIDQIRKLFGVDPVKLQQDILRLSETVAAKALHSDLKQVQFYLNKDLGQFTPKSFGTEPAYNAWKQRELKLCEYLTNKFPIPASVRLLSLPRLPAGDDFYILPSPTLTRAYLVTLFKKAIEQRTDDEPLIPKQTSQLIIMCCRFWRLDFPSKAVCFYTAAHLTGIVTDNLYPDDQLAPVKIDTTIEVLKFARVIIEDQGKLSWDDKYSWSFKDQDEWAKNLTYTYNQTMFGIKESLNLLFSKVAKPKFAPYLELLGDFIESDPLFSRVEESGLIKKWEKKLSKALFRVAETRYAEILQNLPRDDTLNISHIINVADDLVSDVKNLQKRYKSPLLGFLNVPRTVAAVLTAMWGVDSKNIMKHIEAYAQKKHEVIPYGDAIEAYKVLYEIRDIHNQVSTSGVPFKFNLEKYFYPFLLDWVEESNEKIAAIVEEAIKNDTYEPIDKDDDQKKFSTSVLDIFALIKNYLAILESLKWTNEYQLAKIYTILLKSISDGALKYSAAMVDKIMLELKEDELEKEAEQKLERRKSSGWFDEMKNVVNNIQNGGKIETEEPYNFRPATCVALNNLSAMMKQLTNLEDRLDPELISNSVKAYEPARQTYFTSHIFSLRLVRAENLTSSGSSSSNIHPYVTLIDSMARKTIGKTRTISRSNNPEWDEEFEITLTPNEALTLSMTVWDEKMGTHSICGRAVLQLDPRRFKHDGIPQEIFLDLDSQGRLLAEVAVESERVDAIFVMGRAHRALKRAQARCIKLIVEKFSRFIHLCFSRNNLRSICGSSGNIKPTQEQMDQAMLPLYDYLNSNLQVLAEFLTKNLLLEVMLAAWQVVLATADELLLPKLVTAKTFNLSSIGSKLASSNFTTNGWQSAVSSAVANVTGSIGISGFGKALTNNELETVFGWLNFLCFDFFHNDGYGPPVKDLKNEHYQALLLLPVYYDHDTEYLKQEVERLSPAFVKSLRDRNNFDAPDPGSPNQLKTKRKMANRASSIARTKTIIANATSKARAKAALEEQEARSDPIVAQTTAEDMILRLLLIRDEKPFVAKRLEQREKLAHSIATERLARAAAEGRFRKT